MFLPWILKWNSLFFILIPLHTIELRNCDTWFLIDSYLVLSPSINPNIKIQLSNWSANCKFLEETLRWLVMCQVLIPWNVSRMNLPIGLVSINIKTVVKLWQRNFCMRVSICNWFQKISISRNWFLNLIFCLFRTWFLNATQEEKKSWKRRCTEIWTFNPSVKTWTNCGKSHLACAQFQYDTLQKGLHQYSNCIRW